MINRTLTRTLVRSALLGALAVGLASCGGGGNNSKVATTPPTPPPTDAIAFFGSVFATDFHAAATSTPPTPVAGNIIPVSLTTEPQSLTF